MFSDVFQHLQRMTLVFTLNKSREPLKLLSTPHLLYSYLTIQRFVTSEFDVAALNSIRSNFSDSLQLFTGGKKKEPEG
jgi:hypothetical protein